MVALDTFYVGKLKGVGTVWQLTAVDTATRWAICQLFVGDKTAQAAADFVDHVIVRLAEIGVELTAVLTDNGPEFTGKVFTSHAWGHRRASPAPKISRRATSGARYESGRSSGSRFRRAGQDAENEQLDADAVRDGPPGPATSVPTKLPSMRLARPQRVRVEEGGGRAEVVEDWPSPVRVKGALPAAREVRPLPPHPAALRRFPSSWKR